jgi:imidazole glycerol-phosphate synthase subunit HisH
VIGLVDYGRGNIFSIGQALRHLDAPYELIETPEQVLSANRIILPGVGAFGDAIDGLRERGLIEPLIETANSGKPMLGICVGMQMFSSKSEEFGQHDGLNLIAGTVRRLPEGGEIRIPNVGWRRLVFKPDDDLFNDIGDDTMAYFVHSFASEVEDEAHVAATIPVNGVDVAAIVRRDNIVGFQCHPEKSGRFGLGLLNRFLRLSD